MTETSFAGTLPINAKNSKPGILPGAKKSENKIKTVTYQEPGCSRLNQESIGYNQVEGLNLVGPGRKILKQEPNLPGTGTETLFLVVYWFNFGHSLM